MEKQGEQMEQKQIAPEFGSWPCTEQQSKTINQVKWKFDELLEMIKLKTPPESGRYLSLVETKLEEACMFAVKGIAIK